jgi:hypothetical protein
VTGAGSAQVHAPAVQAPVPQGAAQAVPSAIAAVTQPAEGSQASAVQGFPSSQAGGVPATQTPAALQVSAPLQASPSGQAVPAATGAWVQPGTASQPSTVHGLPSSQEGALPGLQVPAPSHASAPLQASPSSHGVPAPTGLEVQPSSASQATATHGFASVQVSGVPAWHDPAPSQVSAPSQASPSAQEVPAGRGVKAQPVAGAQVSVVQACPSSQVGGGPATHEPEALQTSAPLQASPSEQEAPGVTGAWVQPSTASHASTVQGFPSSQAGGVPVTQAPAPLQASAPLQALPSEQEAPAATGAWVQPSAASQASAVHGLPSPQAGGVPVTQAPAALQVSAPLQALPSEQEVPAATGAWVQPSTASQASAVHGLPSSQEGAVPGRQVPAPSHASAPLHAFESAHDTPTATGSEVQPCTASQDPARHGFASVQASGVPAWHAPAPSQVSAPLHASASGQAVPAARLEWTQPVAGAQVSVVQACPSSQESGVPATQAPVPMQASAPLQA